MHPFTGPVPCKSRPKFPLLRQNSTLHPRRVKIWLRNLARQCKLLHQPPTAFYTDSREALAMAVSTHIDTRICFVTELMQAGDVTPEHIAGTEQLADMFTKPVSFPKFQDNVERIEAEARQLSGGCQYLNHTTSTWRSLHPALPQELTRGSASAASSFLCHISQRTHHFRHIQPLASPNKRDT